MVVRDEYSSNLNTNSKENTYPKQIINVTQGRNRSWFKLDERIAIKYIYIVYTRICKRIEIDGFLSPIIDYSYIILQSLKTFIPPYPLKL